MQPVHSSVYGICGRRRSGGLAADIVVFSDGGDECSIVFRHKVIYNSGFFYIALTENTNDDGGKNYLVKISEDFTTLYSKKINSGGVLKNSFCDFSSSSRDKIAFFATQNINFSEYGANGERYFSYMYDVYDVPSTEHLRPDTALKVPYWHLPPFYGNVPYTIAADAADNIFVLGLSYSNLRQNYSRYNSAGVLQFSGYNGYSLIPSAFYENLKLYVCSTDYTNSVVQTIDTTTDTLLATYQYSDSAQTQIRAFNMIYDSNGKVVVIGDQNDATTWSSFLIQLENDLSSLNYNVQIAETVSNCLRYGGVCEHDGYIFAVGYINNRGVLSGIISKFNLSDLSNVANIQLESDTARVYFRSVSSENGNLIIYGNALNLSGNDEGMIIKIIDSDITNLDGNSDTTNKFSFSNVIITETTPATAAWNVVAKTMATTTPPYTTNYPDFASASSLTKTIYQ